MNSGLNVGRTNTQGIRQYLEKYTAKEDLKTGWLGGKTVTDETQAQNKEIAQGLKKLVLERIPLKKQAIITLLIPKEVARDFLAGQPIEARYVESLVDNLGKLLDLYDRAQTMNQVVQADVHFFSPDELRKLEHRFDSSDYDSKIEQLEADKEDYIEGQGKKLKEKGIDDSKTLEQFDDAISKLQAAKDSQNARNSALILNFLNDHGYTMGILLPSFIDAVSAEGLEGLTFDDVRQLIEIETTKTCIMHLVMKNDKPFEYVLVDKFNTAEEVLAEMKKAGIPMELLSENSMRDLLKGDLSERLQVDLNQLVDMSRNLHLVKVSNNFPHIDLKKDFIHIPKGFISGGEYKALGTFDATALREHIESTDFGKLASYNKKDKTLQFYTPEPSQVFTLDGTYKLAVPGNVDMIKDLQRCITVYHLMNVCLQSAQGSPKPAGAKLPPPPPSIAGAASASSSASVNLPPPPVVGLPPSPAFDPNAQAPARTAPLPPPPPSLVAQPKRPLPPPPPAKEQVLVAADTGGAKPSVNPLLASIVAGTTLRKVDRPAEAKKGQEQAKLQTAAASGDPMAALKLAFATRFANARGADDEAGSVNTSDDNDDWD